MTDALNPTDPKAHKLVAAWFARFDAVFSGDNAALQNAHQMLSDHLEDALEHAGETSQTDIALALSALGEPEEVAADWCGAPLTAVATVTPGQSSLSLQVRSVFRGLGFVFGALMVIAAIARWIDPTSVGLFEMSDGTILIGTPNGGEIERDLLGPVTAPLCVLIGTGLLALSFGPRAVWRRIERGGPFERSKT